MSTNSVPNPPGKPSQFLYVLQLAPRLHEPATWSGTDHAAISRHLAYLQAAAERGQVILAGRTAEPFDRTFGVVVFEAADEAAARRFMERDPAVAGQIMTANLHPYQVAVQRGEPAGGAR
jgi:uncharacterized protein YciI